MRGIISLIDLEAKARVESSFFWPRIDAFSFFFTFSPTSKPNHLTFISPFSVTLHSISPPLPLNCLPSSQ
ncbi:hypothetical protein VIGAN_09195000 [Vigna angularis var. angularis]|uniref:Uncharacterized protein n=1 Tax=Vigna angularis var. angularis TaxID=157739 RepID=A0A0S3SZT0_PHAAN|nr:hypothetical protein VIGAN_09195000 [Vigna angularis var. angularis]